MVTWETTYLLLFMVVLFHMSHESRHGKMKHHLKITSQEEPIIIGNFEYKFVSQKLSWSQASIKCKNMGFTLAKLDNNETTLKTLVDYLQRTKPWVKTAWIDSVGNIKSNKNKCCLILEQHNNGNSSYKMLPCKEDRSYICSKVVPTRRTIDEEDSVRDMFRHNYGYRVYYKPAPWVDAKNECLRFEKHYGGKLVELRNKEIVKDLKYIMTHSYYTIEHIWLGGTFKDNQWYWTSDNKEIDINSITGWLHNTTTTYFKDSEYDYTCLNMDTTNFDYDPVYGTDCSYPQTFICIFPADKLDKLQNYEIAQANKRKQEMDKIIHIGKD